MMKATNTKPRVRMRALQAARSAWERPVVRMSVRCGVEFTCAALLAAIPLGGRPLPLAAGLLLSLRFLPDALAAGAGALLGYTLLWPWAAALEPVVLTALFFAGAGLFHDMELRQTGWFCPLLSAALSAAIGFVFLLDQGLNALTLCLFAAKLALAAAAPAVCLHAVDRQELSARRIAALAVFVGFAQLAPPYSAYLAAALGCAVSVASGTTDILPTLLCGLSLDLTGVLPVSMTAALGSGALFCRLLPRREPVFRALCFAAVCLSWELWCGVLSLPLSAACLLGCAGGIVLPYPGLRLPVQPLPQHREAEAPLRRISRVFAMMHRELSGVAPVACESEIADVYDFTAEKVCRMCVRNQICWQKEAEQTYQDLCAAGVPIMQRGSAVREDFPASFADNCRHMEGFITAVNQELDQNRYRRQLRNRLQESRRILASQYLFLSRFLGKLADDAQKPPQPGAVYAPEFAVSSACRPGSEVSGDRGASFRDRWNNYYVLLCDGMGSGEEAAQESGRAVRTLTGLLESGVAPDTAMEILNGFYVLQENSAFATVDLLRVSLATGTGVLYKWGAAPSYLKAGETVKKIGTASPPPGLSVGSDHTAEQLKLSLKDGETLIMVSDGAFGEATEQRAASFRGSTPRELAGYLIAGLREHSEDDITAAVLRLVPETVRA